MTCTPTTSIFALIALFIESVAHADIVQPEQIRLSYGGRPTEMTVTWTTFSPTPSEASNMVAYGVSSSALTNSRNAQTTTFVDPGPAQIVRYIHRATMTGLQPEIRYYYRVGGSAGSSSIFWFRSFPSSADQQLRVCIYGDLGLANGVSMAHLRSAAQAGEFDMVIHLGDIAYDLSADDGQTGDEFLRLMQPITAYIPYMVIVGNQEEKHHYAHYENLFTMPDWENTHNHYYSFNLGAAHFAGFSSELYANANNNASYQLAMSEYNWLQEDLTAANRRRGEVPWLFLFMHRPMYCSNKNPPDCSDVDNQLLRVGNDFLPGLEAMIVAQSLDIVFAGHHHFYERMWPVKNEQAFNDNASNPYHNPPAPIHVLSGSAGSDHEHGGMSAQPTPWSAFRTKDYGYSVLHIYNSTHLRLEQISVDQDGRVIDSTVISKDAQQPSKMHNRLRVGCQSTRDAACLRRPN